MSTHAVAAGTNRLKNPSLPTFDPKNGIPPTSVFETWLVFSILPKILWIYRWLWPIGIFPGYRIVTRYDDVAEVLSRHDIFQVPYGTEMARLNDGEEPGTPFILGIDDDVVHDEQLRSVMRTFRRDDVKTIVEPEAFKHAKEKIESRRNGEMEAIGDLITGVPLHICEAYYGINLPTDLRSFAYASMVVSKQLFGPLPIKSKPGVDAAATYVRQIVDSSLAKAKEVPLDDRTITGRLVNTHLNLNRVPTDQVQAFLMGMIVGFVPTNTIAGGHILEMLLRKPEFQNAARRAARSGDDDLLKHCLFEAMRFMPLNPGPYRICAKDHILAAGTSRARKIRKGQQIWASTMSAMMDERKVRRPHDFVPARPASDYMLFGYGIHWCAGVHIAQAQITQTFKALLLEPKLERGLGRNESPRYRGLFPDRQIVRFR